MSRRMGHNIVAVRDITYPEVEESHTKSAWIFTDFFASEKDPWARQRKNRGRYAHKNIEDKVQWKLAKLYEKGLSTNEIAESLDVHPETVLKYLRKYGIKQPATRRVVTNRRNLWDKI